MGEAQARELAALHAVSNRGRSAPLSKRSAQQAMKVSSLITQVLHERTEN
jgi:hypothetical protein